MEEEVLEALPWAKLRTGNSVTKSRFIGTVLGSLNLIKQLSVYLFPLFGQQDIVTNYISKNL